MKIEFETALKFVLKWEGGFTNHPNDLGGATNKGITQKVYDDYRINKKLAKRSVQLISEPELNEIYENNYWEPVRAKWLRAPLALVMFDTSVNFGPAGALRRLQKALNLKVTGRWTKEISDVIHTCDAVEVALEICKLRRLWRHYRVKKNPSQSVFLKGWLNRDNDLVNEVNKLAGIQTFDFDDEVKHCENSEINFDEEMLLKVSEEDYDEIEKIDTIIIVE